MKYSEDLKHTLNCFPEIKTVWFNEDGEWAFHAREGFNIEVDADDVINDVEPSSKSDSNENKYSELNVAELKAELTRLEIGFPSNANKATLIELLENNNQ